MVVYGSHLADSGLCPHFTCFIVCSATLLIGKCGRRFEVQHSHSQFGSSVSHSDNMVKLFSSPLTIVSLFQ